MFDVKKHLIKVQGGKQYLPVAARLIWFRTEHPDWGIETKPLTIDVERQYAIFESSVYNADGKLMAKGTKMENIRGFGDWLEKAETGAIGRALAVCGFGTQFAPDLDESQEGDSDRIYTRPAYRDDHRSFENRGYAGRSPQGQHASASVGTENLSLVKQESDGAEDAEKHIVPEGDHPCTCESCSAALKPNQLSLSVRKFGSALCPDCQKRRKSEQAA